MTDHLVVYYPGLTVPTGTTYTSPYKSIALSRETPLGRWRRWWSDRKFNRYLRSLEEESRP